MRWEGKIILHHKQKRQQPCQYHYGLLNDFVINVNKGNLLSQYFDVSGHQRVFWRQFFPSQKLQC